MTDITDQDRLEARKWAESIADNPIRQKSHAWMNAVASVILATVDAPAPTLADEIRAWAEKHYSGVVGTGKHELLALAARAEQIEKERDEARAKEKWLELLRSELREERDEARAEAERLTAELETETVALEENVATDQQSNPKETLAGSLPDPADVSPGEAWMVEVDGEQFNAVKDKAEPLAWNAVDADGLMIFRKDSEVTLLRRLVPAPRVIADPDELDKLGDESIVKPDGHSWLYAQYGLWQGKYRAYTSADVIEHFGPVTVLWEAGE